MTIISRHACADIVFMTSTCSVCIIWPHVQIGWVVLISTTLPGTVMSAFVLNFTAIAGAMLCSSSTDRLSSSQTNTACCFDLYVLWSTWAVEFCCFCKRCRTLVEHRFDAHLHSKGLELIDGYITEYGAYGQLW